MTVSATVREGAAQFAYMSATAGGEWERASDDDQETYRDIVDAVLHALLDSGEIKLTGETYGNRR